METGPVAPHDQIVESLRRKVEEYERRFRVLDGHMRVLERERSKLAAVVNNTDAGFLVVDASMKLVWANGVVASILGAGPHQGALMGSECNRILCGRSGPCETCPAQQAGRTGRVAHHELRLDMNGAPRHIYATCMPIMSPDGRIEETIVMLQDVSDLEVLRRSQQALRASEERFRSIFERAAAGMTTVAPDGSFLQVNQAFCRFVGRTPEELLRMTVFDVTHPEDLDKTRQAFQGAAGGARPSISMEKRYVHADGGTMWGYTSAVWLYDADGHPAYAIGMVQDIGERKRAEEALRASEEQLRQAQKMEAVGRLAGGVAHDFNNLLTVISGHSAILLQKLGPDSLHASEVKEIRRAGERAASLTRQLLAFSRKQVLQPKVMDLNATVAEMETMLRRLIGEDIELVTLLEPSLACVRADPGQIEQVIMNLVVNARDAMAGGGRIVLATTELDLPAISDAQRSRVEPGRYVTLSVSDNGRGMDASILSQIFEPFFTTKAQGKGTGLGLSTVYGIIRQTGGYVLVDSQPARGTTFRIVLPPTEGMAAPVDRPRRLPDSLSGSETILLVEDEVVVRELVHEVLRRNGYTVLEASDAPDARLICERHEGRIHLMLTDVVMPLMSGLELAAYLAPLRPDMKVLYMSGYTDEDLDPSRPFLQKPFTPEVLASRVRSLLDDPNLR